MHTHREIKRFLADTSCRPFFLPRRLVRGTPTSGRLAKDGNSWDVASVRWTSPCGRWRAQPLQEFAPHFDRRSVLAIGASELVLNRVHLRPSEWLSADDEPRVNSTRRLGWTWVSGADWNKSDRSVPDH